MCHVWFTSVSVASLLSAPNCAVALIQDMLFRIMFRNLKLEIDNLFFLEIIWVNRTRVKVSEDGLNLVFHRAERKPCSELPVSCNSIWNSLSI